MLLELHENVGEGDNKRIQKFKGLVIQVKKPNHPDGTFTIRGTVAGVVVEKIFPLSFPKFEKVILLDQFAIRRARINYIRDKIGKDAKMKSIITVDVKGKDLLEEAMAEFADDTATQEAAPANTVTEQENTPTEDTQAADSTNTEDMNAETPSPEDTAKEAEKEEEKVEAPQDEKGPEVDDNKETETKEEKNPDEDTIEEKLEEKTDKA
jgi:large subunit ribosomal protein L19